MGKVSFSLINTIKDGASIEPKLILEVLKTNGSMNTIADHILEEINDKAGYPEINWAEVSRWNYCNNSCKGNFRLSFQIRRRFYCSEIESSQTDYIDISFLHAKDSLFVKGEYFNWEINN